MEFYRALYAQLAFALERVKALAPQHPEWQTKQPFKVVLDNDRSITERGDSEVSLTPARKVTLTCRKITALVGVLAALLVTSTLAAEPNTLPSWNDGVSKQAIVEFVESVTDKTRASYVPPPSPHRHLR